MVKGNANLIGLAIFPSDWWSTFWVWLAGTWRQGIEVYIWPLILSLWPCFSALLPSFYEFSSFTPSQPFTMMLLKPWRQGTTAELPQNMSQIKAFFLLVVGAGYCVLATGKLDNTEN